MNYRRPGCRGPQVSELSLGSWVRPEVRGRSHAITQALAP